MNYEEQDPLSPQNKDFYEFHLQQMTEFFPVKLNESFKTIYHITNFKNALSILQNGEMFGDLGLHANFSYKPKPMLAANLGVILKFKFDGEVRATEASMIGFKRPNFTKFNNDIFIISTQQIHFLEIIMIMPTDTGRPLHSQKPRV